MLIKLYLGEGNIRGKSGFAVNRGFTVHCYGTGSVDKYNYVITGRLVVKLDGLPVIILVRQAEISLFHPPICLN